MNNAHPSQRRIQLLPPSLSNQIAAGEVVERPSSVLKELLENSLDAGATDIVISIEDGGQRLISVKDNGFGIPKEEMELAITRHATSKVTTFDELVSVTSYGFRGEALPSIASVSQIRIESAWADPKGITHEGAFIHADFGTVIEKGPSSVLRGTLFTVKDLFTNVPARLKFLKTPATEQKRCQEVVLKLALVRPDVSFSLFSGEREVLRMPAGMGLAQRLAQIWPPQITEGLVPFQGERFGIHVHGVASVPQNAQAKGDRIFLFVNNRPVTDKLILRAVRDAYKGRLTSREYPQVVLFLELDPKEVDVNVHPAKSEVRFREERSVFSAVITALETSLTKNCAFSGAFEGAASKEIPFAAQPESSQPEDTRVSAMRSDAGGPVYPPLFQNKIPSLENALSTADSVPLDTADRSPRPSGFWGAADAWPTMPAAPTADIADTDNAWATEPPTFSRPFQQNPNTTAAEQPAPMYMASHTKSSASLPDSLQNEATARFGTASSLATTRLLPDHGVQQSFFEHSSAGHDSNAPLGLNGMPSMQTAPAYVIQVGPFLCFGQIEKTYILLKEQETLLLVDQHAAHERVLLAALTAETVQSQLLALPKDIALHPAEQEKYEASQDELTRLGFCLSLHEGQTLQVKGFPSLLSSAQAMDILQAILADQTDGFDSILHFMACRAAIKAGQTLTADEVAGLLQQWMHTKDYQFCPHGRPIVLRFGVDVLEKLFKRKVG